MLGFFIFRSRRGRVRTENPQVDDQVFEFGERGSDFGVATRRVQIQIKPVLPRAAVHRAAFDLHQVDIPARERLERMNESAGAVIELENE